MTLETKQETKNGGPYTKQEQEKRRNKVYELYFEKGLPGIKIAEDLGVNRNTINSDIKVLLSQVSSCLGDEKITGAILTQLQRLEIQRKRLLDLLDQKDFQKTITVERLLLEIEGKISSILSRVGSTLNFDRFVARDDITEEEISEFVRNTIFSAGFISRMKKDSILESIISYQKCDLKHAEIVLDKMIALGLGLGENPDGPMFVQIYDLKKFALLRQYILPKEITQMKDKERIKGLEKKYLKKFGPDRMKWPHLN